MADVTPTDYDRGQLMIVVALAMAILFVGLAVVLNSAIYAENFSTQATSDEASTILEQRSNHADDLQRAIDRANRANDDNATTDDPGDIEDHLHELQETQSETASLEAARRGESVSVTLTDNTSGAQLNQSDPERAFTNRHGDGDWTLANNATEAGTFTLRIYEENLLDLAEEGINVLLADTDDLLLGGVLFHETFHVEVTDHDNDEIWRVYFFQISSPPDNVSVSPDKDLYMYSETVSEDEPDGLLTQFNHTREGIRSLLNLSCGTELTDEKYAEIDIRNGEPCEEELGYYEDEIVGNEHDIAFRNAETEGLSDPGALLDNIHGQDEDMFEEIVDELVDDPQSLCSELLGPLTCTIVGGVSDLLDLLLGELGVSALIDELVDIIDDLPLTGGDRATGTYDIVVDTEVDADEDHDFHPYGDHDDDPTRRHIVFSGQASMEYRTSDATFNSTDFEVRWSGAEP